jgi:UDP-3-O-[3-hydroxymyristoyl] glucosamine N-acyltransferase
VITVTKILEFLGPKGTLRLLGPESEILIKRPAPITEAGPGDVSFCGSTARDPGILLAKTRASLIIVDETIPIDEVALSHAGVKAIFLCDNARLHFIRVVEHFFSRPIPHGVHPSSVIAASAVIGSNVYIGPLCSIGERVEIGEGTVIFAGVHIYDGVRVGKKVTIHSGTVIGADGFGYERNEAGGLEKFPHVGGVLIEDAVEIGANTCIDRGTLGDTQVCEGARIDNLVHIAHNVYVGRHAVVIANAMIGGGTHIGDFAWVAPSACLRDRINIGDKSVVGLASLVTKDVPNEVTVLGSPARPFDEQRRLLAHWASVSAISMTGEDESE